MTLPVCTIGQKPYELYHPTSPTVVLSTGDTPGEACMLFAGSQGFLLLTDSLCSWEVPTTTPASRALRQVCTEFDETDPFTLTTAEGALITGAILLVWALGFAFRVLIRTLDIDGNHATSTSESE